MPHNIYHAENQINYTIERIKLYNEQFDTKKTLGLLEEIQFTTDDLHDDCHEDCASVDEYSYLEKENQELNENLNVALNKLNLIKEKAPRFYNWFENFFINQQKEND